MRCLLVLAALCAFLVPTSAVAAQGRPLPASARVADDALTRALERGALSEAQYALERARSLFRLAAVRREFGDVARPDPHAATFILRDLAFRVRHLAAPERREAEAILARPDDGDGGALGDSYEPDALLAEACDAEDLCVHWDENTANTDAPPGADDDITTTPAWVSTTITELQNVWTKEIGTFGYREPLPDGDDHFDVYLVDLGPWYFGYCAPEPDPGSEFFDAPGYCALDDDFLNFCGDLACLPEQAEKFLQVTAAHEFFHAVQFAYDAWEDIAFMEQTAMWMEDEVYNDVNDNRAYLRRSALTNPAKPIDYGAGGYEYGNWIFWRFVSHRYDRDVVRRAWQLADGSSTGPDYYSIGALRRALSERTTSLHSFFAFFGRANRRPAAPAHYDEGADADYPAAPLSATYKLGRTGATGWKSPRLNHLTNRYYAFKPKRSVARKAALRVSVDLPKLKTKPLANLVVFLKSGAVKLKPIALDSAGNGRRRVPFGRAQVKRVELVLTNGSSRIDWGTCWSGLTAYSCGGAVPRDDGGKYAFAASVR